MSEKRFNFHLNRRNPYEWLVFDGENIIVRTPYKRVATDLVNLLNSLYDENEQLRNIIKQKEKEERLYAKEILRLNELNKQTSEFTDILGGY